MNVRLIISVIIVLVNNFTSLLFFVAKFIQIQDAMYAFWPGMRIRSDPLIFGPPDPVLFSTDPDPTCNNGFIKLFSS